MKKSKTYSIQKIFLKYMLIMLTTSTVSLLFFGIFSYWTGIRQLEYSSDASINVYTTTLQTEMAELSDFARNLCLNDTAYQLLSSGYYTVNEKITFEYNLRNLIRSKTAPYTGILIFSDKADTSMYQYGSMFLPAMTKPCYEMKQELKEYYTNASPENLGVWQTYSNSNFSVLMYAYQYNGLYICTLIELNYFTPQEYDSAQDKHLQICFFDDERILSNQKIMEEQKISHTDLLNKSFRFLFDPALIRTAPVNNSDISIACSMPVDYMGTYFRVSVLSLIVMLVLFTALFIVMAFSFRDVLRYPVDQITNAAASIEQNDIDSFLSSGKSNIIEFQMMNDALGNLIRQKISLERENEHEKFEKDHAMLQYFQLQTRSHFFINCLKSLYSMLESREYEKMQRMILAFSNHLRFIFHDNLKLVPLSSELKEVNDYYNIILMDRSKPILLIQEVDKTLLDFQVPPLLIQTFLENSIKYNVQSEKLLCFTIHIEKTQLEGQPVVQFRLTDNGVGYDEDMLQKLNCENSDLYEDYHVGITNLKKRIQIIYKSGFQLAFLNGSAGGACSLIYLPMEEI